MRKGVLIAKYRGSELIGVPAVHYHYLFAEAVNHICANEKTRPDAIAVELSPNIAREAKAWLAQLVSHTSENRHLPIMFGLLKKNRMLRPSQKEKAQKLQETTGQDLANLSPKVLLNELGFYPFSLFCLSPTDSIVEAIRCSVEMNVPLYGVDLDDFPQPVYGSRLIPDPLGTWNSMHDYVLFTVEQLGYGGDPEVDRRREVVMAARLKALLLSYQRVLFTGGLGHYANLVRLVKDPDLRPASRLECEVLVDDGCRKVVVPPAVGIDYISLFPYIAQIYEAQRSPVGPPFTNKGTRPRLDPTAIFHRLLSEACKEYFSAGAAEALLERRLDNLLVPGKFLTLLSNSSLLELKNVPHLSDVLSAATQTIGRDFAEFLFNKFCDISWIKPEDYPGCEVISFGTSNGPEVTVITNLDGIELERRHIIMHMPGGSETMTPSIVKDYASRWVKSEEEADELRSIFPLIFCWHPWENLITSMSVEAISKSKVLAYERITEVYQGSLLEGIDVKKSLRAFSRGRDTMYVKDSRKREKFGKRESLDGFPVIWLLDPSNHSSGDWIMAFEFCEWLRDHVASKDKIDSVAEERGKKMVTFVCYGDERTDCGVSNKKDHRVRCDKYYGVILFSPICWSTAQFAQWNEMTGYSRNPFVDYGSIDLLLREAGMRKDAHGQTYSIDIDEEQWPSAMISLALPFASRSITVIAPDDYQIPAIVHERSARFGIKLNIVFLNNFLKKDLKRLSRGYFAPAVTPRPMAVFDASIEKAIGESQHEYQELVPDWIKSFPNSFG